MTQWNVSDQDSASSVQTLSPGDPVRWIDGDALDSALNAERGVALLSDADGALIVTIERVSQAASKPVSQDDAAALPNQVASSAARWTDKDAVAYQATGLLGLMDEPIYEEEDKPKSWWRRLLE